MLRDRLIVVGLAVLVLVPASTALAQVGQPGRTATTQAAQCPDGCPARATIIGNTFNSSPIPPETGPYSYTVTVYNGGDYAGDVWVRCAPSTPQLSCAVAGTEMFTLGAGASRDVTITYSVKGLGDPSQAVTVTTDDLYPQTVSFVSPVRGASFIVPAYPLALARPFDAVTALDTLRVRVAHPNGVLTSSFVLKFNNVAYAAGSWQYRTTDSTLVMPVAAITNRTDTTSASLYACTGPTAGTGRCETVAWAFRIAGPVTPFALDDSLPPAVGSGAFNGLLGGLPVPPVGSRGCAIGTDDPEINLGGIGFLYQPGSPGGKPSGYVFPAGVVLSDTFTISTRTVDLTPTRTAPRCADYNFLSDASFDYAYWAGTSLTDPLWAGYPWGDRSLALDPSVDGDPATSPFALASLDLPRSHGPSAAGYWDGGVLGFPGTRWHDTPRAPDPETATPSRPHRDASGAMPGVTATDAPLLARLRARLPDPGAISIATFRLWLNGTLVVSGTTPQVAGVTVTSADRSGFILQFTGAVSSLHRYVDGNPTADNGGWNEIVAQISDSTGHTSAIRGRFVVLPAGPVAPLTLTALRNTLKSDLGECAAFGPFQCGGVFAQLAIPGFVSRDRDRSLHLVYRSASQLQRAILPVRVQVRRAQRVPDSLWVTPRVGAASVGPTLRYAAAKGYPTAYNSGPMSESADEDRVVGALVDTAAGQAGIRSVSTVVRSFFTVNGTVSSREDSVTQELVTLRLTDQAGTWFGPGWQLAELQRLVLGQVSQGAPAAIWIQGDGSYTVFRKPASTWIGQPGEPARLVSASDSGAAYAIHLENGASIGFRADGWQAWTRDLVGNYTMYKYAGTPALLAQVVDPTGMRLEFARGSGTTANLVTSITRVGIGGIRDTIATLDYAGSGSAVRLAKVRLWKSGTAADSTRFGYDAGGLGALLTTITSPRDSAGRPMSTTFAYDTIGSPTVAQRPDGRTWLFRDAWRRAVPRPGRGWPVAGQGLERSIATSQMLGTAVPFTGRPTDYAVDVFGYPAWVRTIARPPVLTSDFRLIAYGADQVRRITRDSIGRPLVIVANPDSARLIDSLRYRYDAFGRIDRIYRPSLATSAPGATDSVTFVYDTVTLAASGQWCSRLLRVRDVAGAVDTVAYGSGGVARCLPSSITSGVNSRAPGITKFTYDNLLGSLRPAGVRPITITGADSVTDSVAYDVATWNTNSVSRTVGGATSQIQYDWLGRAIRGVDPAGRITEIVLDRLGRPLLSRTGVDTLAPVTRTTYDAGGLITKVEVYSAAAAEGVLNVPRPGTPIQATRYFFNRLNLLDSVVGPGSRTAGGGSHRARVESNVYRNAFDLPDQRFTGNGSFVAYAYDDFGRISQMVHSAAMPGYSVDRERFADDRTLSWLGFLGSALTRHYSQGQGYTYAYDGAGRLIETTSADASLGDSSFVRIRRAFRANGQLLADTTWFRNGPAVARSYEYSRRGQRTKVQDALLSGSLQFGDASGKTLYWYDSLTARLDSLQAFAPATAGTPFVRVAFTWDNAGREKERRVYLGTSSSYLTTQRFYNTKGLVDSLLSYSTGGTANAYVARGLTYDQSDRVTAFTSQGEEASQAGAHSYQYSPAGRLTSSSEGQRWNSWVYDVFGNRVQEIASGPGVTCGSGNQSYGPDNQLLARNAIDCVQTIKYFQDQAGSRLGTADTSGFTSWVNAPISSIMTYTAARQLYFAMTPTGVVGHFDSNWNWYDAEGRRVMGQFWGSAPLSDTTIVPSRVSTGRMYYLYDGSDVQLEYEYVSAGTWRVRRRHVFVGLDDQVAGRFWNPGYQSDLAVQKDRLGTPIRLVTSSGAMVFSAFYGRDPYGNLSGTNGQEGQPVAGTGFTGASTPNATGGFTYLRNRWYDPKTGRFLTQDPIGLAGGVNLYAYAGNDPVSHKDPFGLLATDCCLEEAAATALAAEAIPGAQPVATAALAVVTAVAAAKVASDKLDELKSVTYTRTNLITGQVYSGMTSGFGDPSRLVAAREARHPERLKGFGPAQIDNVATGVLGAIAIRGREQQLIDFHGGAQRQGGTSANIIRSIARERIVFGRAAWAASNASFGPLAPYTGY